MDIATALKPPQAVPAPRHSPTLPVLSHPAVSFACLLLVALLLRWDTFGDPNLHGDEVFYHTVGAAMHQGAIPYVDVWDRKPFGLFLFTYLITAISTAPIVYQLVATLCATGTAWAISQISREWAGAKGALLAGVAYLLWLAPLQGFGGQSPVYYNLFIAIAALLVFRALPALREGRVPPAVPAAMLLAGYGLTIKTTALFEAAFLGLYATWALLRSGTGVARTLRNAALWALIGAAPALIFAFGYWAIGHWTEYWHAMITSNISKPPHWPTSMMRLRSLSMALAPLALFAVPGLIRLKGEARVFLSGWLAAAICGLAAVPNFYLHYGLPLLVPLCVAASAFLARGILGFAAVGFLTFLSFTINSPFRFDHAAESRAAIDDLATTTRAHLGGGPLLLYDAPPQLYRLTGQPFITPLVFPTHLSHVIERDVSHLNTLAETRRVLALRPGAVVMAEPPRNAPVNEETHQLVLAYVDGNCRLVKVVATPEWQRTDNIAVWGDCRR